MVSAASFLTMYLELGPLLHRLQSPALGLYQERLELLAHVRNSLARAPSLKPCQEPFDSVRPREPPGLAALHRHFRPARELCLQQRAAQVPVLSFCALLILKSFPPIRSPSLRVSIPARHLLSMVFTHREPLPWIVTTAPATMQVIGRLVRVMSMSSPFL